MIEPAVENTADPSNRVVLLIRDERTHTAKARVGLQRVEQCPHAVRSKNYVVIRE